MIILNKLIVLASKLVDNEYTKEAEQIIAQVLNLSNISDIKLVTPDHPLFPLLKKLLHPSQMIDEKLADFYQRLTTK